FGGMPTYQLGAKYPHNYIKKLDLTLRFLPRPADYLFLYFIGIYILFLMLKVDYKLAFIGALAFGFSTYLIIILGVGHNAKAHAIAYMPLVLSGIILTFRGKYLAGFLLTAVAMALELVANHFQMTYYLLLLVICLGFAYLVDAYRKNMLPHFFKAIGVMVMAVVLSLGLNATNILATKEYAATSTRGKSAITINSDGTPKEGGSGLSYEYITEYSYGKLESLNLFIPNFMGGGSSDGFPDNSEAAELLMNEQGASRAQAQQFLNEQIPMYWGDQTIVAAPAYIGAVIVFLSVLALFLVRGRLKWWILAGFILSLFLSWGRNFSFLTEFFIDYVPLYDKFRAVSSIQVIIELILPMLAVVGLQQYFNDFHSKEQKKKALLLSTGIVGGITLLLILFKSALPYSGPYDSLIIEQMGIPFMDAIRADRAAVMASDAIRSLIFVLLSAGTLWLVFAKKMKEVMGMLIIGLLVLVDLVGVGQRYVNKDNFVNARMMEQPFQQSTADIEIAKDKGHYRVYDVTRSAFNSGQASFYHNALGGYHAAKPGRMQDLDDFYLSDGDVNVLNMLNVKYFITANKEGKPVAQPNPYTNGPAWYVSNVLPANNTNEEILLLDSLDTKSTAVIHVDLLAKMPVKNVVRDSTATIDLTKASPNELVYETATKSDQLAVFSEMYYPDGWNAYIDGALTEHFRVNYTLRGMVIPKGIHQVVFKFEPKVVKTGSTLSLASSVLLFVVFLGGLWLWFRKEKAPK
ncbi:MAG: YfhO family protein, partial [Bacteroidetes bacterium]|nr:YfhO family protein [Bacteroidota bacterium]